MSITTTVRISARTDVGQIRDHNEDNFVVCKDVKKKVWNDIRPDNFQLGELGSLLMVADGMGGAEAGEEASRIAIETVQSEFSKLESIPKSDHAIYTFLKKTIVNAHQAIVDESIRNPNWYGMGTTAILAWVIDNKAYLCWSGDSRCYKYNDKGLELLMDEHSYVWQTFVKKGKMTPEEARNHPESNLITQNLGDARNTPKPDVKKITFKKGDRILLCSDGLNGMISDQEIESIIAKGEDLSTTCKELVEAANNAGGDDNITLVLMDVDDLVGVPAGANEENNTGGASSKFGKSMASKAMLITALLMAGIVAAIYFGMKGDETDAAAKTGKQPTEKKTPAKPLKDDVKENPTTDNATVIPQEDLTKDEITKEPIANNAKKTEDLNANLAKKNKTSGDIFKGIDRADAKIKEYKNKVASGKFTYINKAALDKLESQKNQFKHQYENWLKSPDKALNVITTLSEKVGKLEGEINEGTFLNVVNPSSGDTATSPSNNNESATSNNSKTGLDDIAAARREKNKKVIDGKKQTALKNAFVDLLDEKFRFGEDPHYKSIKDAKNSELMSTSDGTGNPEGILKQCDNKMLEIAAFIKKYVMTEKGAFKRFINLNQINAAKYEELKKDIGKHRKALKTYGMLTKEIKLK